MGVCGVPGCTGGRLLPPLLPGKGRLSSGQCRGSHPISSAISWLPSRPQDRLFPSWLQTLGRRGRVIPVPQTHSLTQLL